MPLPAWNPRIESIRPEVMLSRETLERYQRMTTGERLRLALQAINENEPALLAGTAEVVERRFQLINQENSLRSENILRGLLRGP